MAAAVHSHYYNSEPDDTPPQEEYVIDEGQYRIARFVAAFLVFVIFVRSAVVGTIDGLGCGGWSLLLKEVSLNVGSDRTLFLLVFL
jgi:hypothetical protein